MNLKNILLIFLSAFIFGSCDDYLDVSPKDEVIRDELFNTEKGFYEALSGVYIALKNDQLYGKALTLTTVEHMVSNWNVAANTTQESLTYFKYEGAQSEFENIYLKAYSAIAQANVILEYIDAKNDEGVFVTPGFYEIIKGECLAIRAYCHFDLLRIFGPVPTMANDSTTILPYMSVLSTEPVPHSNYQALKIKLESDVNEAIELLNNDPIIKYSVLDLRSERKHRDIRFNYYAAVALKARMHLWFGEKDQAYLFAKEVIDAVDDSGGPKFRLGVTSDMLNNDLQLSCENVMGLYVHNLATISSDLFERGELRSALNLNDIENELYEESASDIRSVYLWEEFGSSTSKYCSLVKYKNIESESRKDIRMLPLIRISEMYFIAIESTENLEIANELWAEFQRARNITVTELPSEQKSKELQIIKEFRKEFFAEGQAFFAYKRLNFDQANMLWVPGAAVVNYVIPLPKTELVAN